MKEVISKKIDVVDKTIDLVSKIYDDSISKPTKVISNGLSMCLSFVGAMVSPVMYEYIQNAEYKKKEIDKKLEKKYNLIPDENKTIPRMNILGPAVELLKYNLDEQYIKDIFVSIMFSEMNSEMQYKVLPSYIDIVRQLSRDDANMLKMIYDAYSKDNNTEYPLCVMCSSIYNSRELYDVLDNYLVINPYGINKDKGFNITVKLDGIVIDNLCRLGLIKLREDRYLHEDYYELVLDILKPSYSYLKDCDIFMKKGIFELTEFGKNFILICFN